MAADFIGLKVQLKLKPPHNYDLTGLITDVRDQRLYLANVHLPKTNQYLPSAQFLGTDVADIEVVSSLTPNPPNPPVQGQQASRTLSNGGNGAPAADPASMSRTKSWQYTGLTPSSLPPQTKGKKPLQDPAILSFTRATPPPRGPKAQNPPPFQAAPPPRNVAQSPILVPPISAAELSAIRPEPTPLNTHIPPSVSLGNDRGSASRVSATLSTPFTAMSLDDHAEDDATAEATPTNANASVDNRTDNYPDYQADTNDVESKSKTRRGRRGNRRRKNTSDLPEAAHGDSSPEMTRSRLNVPGKKKSGWRETPIIQEPEMQPKPDTNPVPGLIGGKVGRQAANASVKKTRRQRALETTSGWATEDVSDIQEMGDFDFEGNLSQFDKKAVFEQLRKGETTADEDRLVVINRPHGSGALGPQRKLRHDENVLEKARVHSGELQSTNDESDLDPLGGPPRKPLSRKQTDSAPSMEYSRSGSDFMRTGRSISHAKYSSSHTTGSPRFRGGAGSPPSPATVTRSKRSSLRYVTTGRTCPAISPSTLAVIENLAISKYLLSEDIIDEKAGLTIASAIISSVHSNIGASGRRSVTASSHTPSRPVLVFLIADHKGGARALVAARELLDRAFECIVVVSSWQVGDLLHYAAVHPRIGTQLRRFADLASTAGTGRVCTWADASRHLKTLEAPPELIIDALAPLLPPNPTNADANWNRDPTAAAMAAWANRSKATVLAVDIPSGVDAVTGDVEVVEGEPAEIRAQAVVCGGAPTVGIVRALEARGEEWVVLVGDTGVGPAWKSLAERNDANGNGEVGGATGWMSRSKGADGAKGKIGVEFGEAWSVEVRFERVE